MLVFATFNDTAVGEMQFSWYGGLGDRLSYPKTKSIRYPKVKSVGFNVSCIIEMYLRNGNFMHQRSKQCI